jgi:hypothetical protein
LRAIISQGAACATDSVRHEVAKGQKERATGRGVVQNSDFFAKKTVKSNLFVNPVGQRFGGLARN